MQCDAVFIVDADDYRVPAAATTRMNLKTTAQTWQSGAKSGLHPFVYGHAIDSLMDTHHGILSNYRSMS
jgi:hypothetical protein